MAAPDEGQRSNPAQRAAVEHGDGPLLVIAGAGSGKTQTLAHRVAALIGRGADPRRILLLTFTRRAAQEMTRRVGRLIWDPDRVPSPPRWGSGGEAACAPTRLAGAGRESGLVWAGTFHAVANRLLRLHAAEVGLAPQFTLLDREDAADLLDRLRHQRGLSGTRQRFPRKGTCLAIYSRAVNTQAPLRACLEAAFPWCLDWEEALRGLFAAYADAKSARQVLDYDDLLLYWFHLMSEPALAARVGERFDHVLVDEYQDTNALQGEILRRLKPDGRGVTVVGDRHRAWGPSIAGSARSGTLNRSRSPAVGYSSVR